MPSEEEPLGDASHAKMVSLKDGQIIVRKATFLKPTAKHVNEAALIPNITPMLSQILPHHQKHWPSKVIFKCSNTIGCNSPNSKWEQWVDRLAPTYRDIWIQAGIYDAILSSTFGIKFNQELVLGLSEYWCADTNTFVFHWGEATVTLEDVMILGGYPVYGESVVSGLQSQDDIVEKLKAYRTEVGRSRANKAGLSEWIKFFMEKETEYEHAAFLSFWLSKFLFTSVSQLVQKDVFSIAAKLSLGIRVALAPAVLASLYKDLRKLNEEALACSQQIVLLAPFQLLQIWAFERFPTLAPKCPNPIQPGEPRMARWHKKRLKVCIPQVRSVVELEKNFKWRPYVADLRNWKHPSYHRETELSLSDYSQITRDDGLHSFFRIIQATELVGLHCTENYSPHRVSMQFGMDQDLPGEIDELDVSHELVNFCIPPRTFQPGVTERYSKWWKDSLNVREKSMKHIVLEKKNLLNSGRQEDGDTKDSTIASVINRRKHKVLSCDDVESYTKQPDPAIVECQSKKSAKALNESKAEDSNQPIALSSSEDEDEDSDDDRLPISTCMRKSFNKETSAVASQTSYSGKRKLEGSYQERYSQSQKKVCTEEILSEKRSEEMIKPLKKTLDMNTDTQFMNERAGHDNECERSNIKSNKEYVIQLPDRLLLEPRTSKLEKILPRLKVLKAAKSLELRASS